MTSMVTVPQPPTRASDAVTFDGLYLEHAQPIYNFILRLVRDSDQAQDVCQEVWTKVYRNLHTVRDAAATRGWLYRVARHSVIDAARHKAARPATTDLDYDPPAPGENPLDAVIHKEQIGLAWQALGALPERQQTALYLKEVDGRCYREIGAVLDCSESAVEALLVRARRSFAARFEGFGADRAERCAQARQVMSIWIDGEGTPVQRKALLAHLGECAACRDEAAVSERHLEARAAVPLIPFAGIPLFNPGAGLSLATASQTASSLPFLSRIAEAFTAHAASVALSVTASTAVAVSAIFSPAPPAREAQPLIAHERAVELDVGRIPSAAVEAPGLEDVGTVIKSTIAISVPALDTTTPLLNEATSLVVGSIAYLLPAAEHIERASGLVNPAAAGVARAAGEIVTAGESLVPDLSLPTGVLSAGHLATSSMQLQLRPK